MIVQPHGHNSNHVVFVLEGDMTCGDVHCPAGTHIALDQGDTFGPFVAGPDGVVLFEVMMGDPRSFPADDDGYERFLADTRRAAAPEPADRHARLRRGHTQLNMALGRERTVRARVGLASPATRTTIATRAADRRRSCARRPRSRSRTGSTA